MERKAANRIENRTNRKANPMKPKKKPVPKFTKPMMRLVEEIAQECHAQGRIYSSGGEIESPATQFELAREYATRRMVGFNKPRKPSQKRNGKR